VTDEGEECPIEPYNYSSATDLQETLIAQVPLNQYTLNCDPYDETIDCDTYPPLPTDVTNDTVCGLNYNNDCSNYNMTTYANQDDAIKDQALVTHTGACGTCSTTQDLAVYMKITDMTTVGKKCAVKSILNKNLGLQCYLDLGMTLPCAWIWLYDGLYDSQVCTKTCLSAVNEPYNIEPNCTLNACLQCDEDLAGPIFQQYAGRTRRRSGLESTIQRPCDTIAHIDHTSCPYTSNDRV